MRWIKIKILFNNINNEYKEKTEKYEKEISNNENILIKNEEFNNKSI